MNFKTLLTIGEEFEYPLVGGENLFQIFPALNERFSLNINRQNFTDSYAKYNDQNLIELIAISTDRDTIYTFINKTEDPSLNAPVLPFIDDNLDKVRLVDPVNFKEELDFLKTISTNTMVSYDWSTSKKYEELYHLLNTYTTENWTLPPYNSNTDVDKFIVRYYGLGDGVPSQYGIFDASLTVSIIDLKRQGVYKSYCLRNKLYHVYDNGYRLRN